MIQLELFQHCDYDGLKWLFEEARDDPLLLKMQASYEEDVVRPPAGAPRGWSDSQCSVYRAGLSSGSSDSRGSAYRASSPAPPGKKRADHREYHPGQEPGNKILPPTSIGKPGKPGGKTEKFPD